MHVELPTAVPRRTADVGPGVCPESARRAHAVWGMAVAAVRAQYTTRSVSQEEEQHGDRTRVAASRTVAPSRRSHERDEYLYYSGGSFFVAL